MLMRNAVLCLVVLAACASSKSGTQSSSGGSGEFPEPPSPIARQRLQERVDNIKYQRGETLVLNLERIVAQGDAAITACLNGLKSEDAMVRMGSAYCLGRIGNTKTMPYLQPLLADSSPFVRYETAAAMGQMGSRAGYAVLVSGLEDDRIEYRHKCFQALQDFTGQTFGYSHNDSLESRKVAVQRWQDWLKQIESEKL